MEKSNKKSKKKSKKLTNKQRRIISLLVLIALIAIIVLIVALVTTKGKKPISVDVFKGTFDESEYEIVDVKEQFSDYEYVKDAYVAISNNSPYQIEFYVLENNDYAITFFNNNKSIFESSKGDLVAETSADMKNCSRYTLVSNNKYMFLSRIDNTVVYVNANNSYSDTINEMINKLGY